MPHQFFTVLSNELVPNTLVRKGILVSYGTVNMTFCGKVDNRIRLMNFKQMDYKLCVVDIAADKNMLGNLLQGCKVFQIPSLRQCIKIDDFCGLTEAHPQRITRANKPGSTSNQQAPHYSSLPGEDQTMGMFITTPPWPFCKECTLG